MNISGEDGRAAEGHSNRLDARSWFPSCGCVPRGGMPPAMPGRTTIPPSGVLVEHGGTIAAEFEASHQGAGQRGPPLQRFCQFSRQAPHLAGWDTGYSL